MTKFTMSSYKRISIDNFLYVRVKVEI